MYVFDEYSLTGDEVQFEWGIFVCVLIWLIIVMNTFAGIAATCHQIMLRYKRHLYQEWLKNNPPQEIDELVKTYQVRGKDDDSKIDLSYFSSDESCENKKTKMENEDDLLVV